MEYLTDDNKKYLKIMAQTFDKSPLQFLNGIIEAHKKKNRAIYDKAEQATATGGKFSLIK